MLRLELGRCRDKEKEPAGGGKKAKSLLRHRVNADPDPVRSRIETLPSIDGERANQPPMEHAPDEAVLSIPVAFARTGEA